MKILIACEYSGIVRDAFNDIGHNATSCDLLPTDSPGPHIQADVLEILNQDWDLMIAHPPCTHLAVSGARWFETKMVEQRKAIYFFLALANAPIKKICIENPIGIMSSFWKKPDQIIHPYYFGNSIQKSTCLWLKNLPKLTYAKQSSLFYEQTSVLPQIYQYNSLKTKSSKSNYSILGKLGSGKGKERSKFFIEVARAMALQWG